MFVMDIYHQPAQARDEALYHYAVMLVETVQEKLKAAKEHDDFINHVIYAQCAMMDDAVLNTASSLENSVWLHNPLQARFVMQMRAGEVMFERVRELLHQAAPDPRLLVLYQRLFGMGFSQRWSNGSGTKCLTAGISANMHWNPLMRWCLPVDSPYLRRWWWSAARRCAARCFTPVWRISFWRC